MIFFCAALSLSHLRCQLPPGGSLGLSVLFVRCVSVLFAGIVHCTREEKQITPCKRTIAVRLLSGAFPINYKYGIMSRNAPPLPYGRSAHSVRNRRVCRYRLLYTGGKTDYTEQTDNCPWQLSGAFPINYKYGIMSRNAPPLPYGRSVHSVRNHFVCTRLLITEIYL